MFQQTFAIVRNTFFESIRQPVMLVVLLVATIMIVLSNPLSAFTMENDQRMLIDLGLATVFICGCLLSAFIATNVLGREIENRTALTVISKPVPRPVFVLGKFLGVAGAISLGTLYMTFVFMLTEQHTVLQTVRDPLHGPVIVFGFLAGLIGVSIAVWCNFFYGKVFASTVIVVTTPLAGLAYLLSMMFTPHFSAQPISVGFKPQLWLAVAALWMAILVLSAIAVAASTRLGQVLTLVITLGVFMLGMLSDWMFGRPMAALEQSWSQRVKSQTPGDIEKLLGAGEGNAFRAWVESVRSEQAYHYASPSMWHCALVAEIQKRRPEYTQMSPAERDGQIATLRQEVLRNTQEKLDSDLRSAHETATALTWPLTGSQLVQELDWPLVVELSEPECETIANRKVLVYPPAVRAVASASERLEYSAFGLARVVLPNFQVMFLSDALTQGHLIPVTYVIRTMLYGVLYIGAALALATFLFQTREVG